MNDNRSILVLGGNGLVGSRFRQLSKYSSIILSPNHSDLNITDLKQLSDFLKREKPGVVINFAAYTNVSEAENQRGDKNGDCWQINVTGVENLLTVINQTKTQLIQISTDMIFSGSQKDPGPYSEDHPAEKDSSEIVWYGHCKKIAEDRIKENLGDNYTIVRLIYPVRAQFDRKLDYLRKPLKLYDEGKLYPMFDDQQISITFIDEACLLLDKIIAQKYKGIYHVCSDLTTPYHLVNYLLFKARGKINALQASSIDDFIKKTNNPVRYPKFGGLSAEKTEKIIGTKFLHWMEVVNAVLKH